MTLLSSKNTTSTLSTPFASTSHHIPHLLSTPFHHHRPMSSTINRSRYLRLSPSNRTKLTNTFFIFACTLSVITVSLGMSGGKLPCPARPDGNSNGLGLEGEADEVRFERRLRKKIPTSATTTVGGGKGKGREFDESLINSNMTMGEIVKENKKSKRQWLEDPKPISKRSWASMLSNPPAAPLASSIPNRKSRVRTSSNISNDENDSNNSRIVELV